MSGKENGERKIDDIARVWWHRHRQDRGAMAELRRALGLAEPLMIPAGLALLRESGMREEWQVARIAVIAHVLAFVREDEKTLVARAIGKPGLDAEGSEARVKPIRLRRLLSIPDDDLVELATAMRRLVRQLDGRANVGDLARAIFFWNERTRRDWVMQWHGYGSGGEPGEAPAPDSDASAAA